MVEQTEKLREMNESYLTMLDYEKVLENVGKVLPRLGGGGANIRGSVHGGAHIADDEEDKQDRQHYSLNPDLRGNSEKVPLIEEGAAGAVHIAHIAGTIEVDEKARLKKLLFRATRGKALTFFDDFEVP